MPVCLLGYSMILIISNISFQSLIVSKEVLAFNLQNILSNQTQHSQTIKLLFWRLVLGGCIVWVDTSFKSLG